ncbi:cell cycle protein MesJ [Candidatus Blochmanniella floridana]|uniref:tRNA(Ile)-lysidine synthase n=1 Tax=Blochmanniella floridana TaxID=203907 RepID=TILS_BLOFL|nr:RecName: Full=tRNA(Ile)-lysidine synthase; AltName: Full=tRNA(Ile)-2-lysyl-cytidine synthase; AltName: Full=tRNA(Ile)-lysidine synthetase [Candidatus Blochmannia floridanus]CAD83359.1 cell cycle protein MesJ [Candidatus Blochmannia floridanus]
MNSTNFFSHDLYLYHQVIRCIVKYRNLLLAYSGGMDSTVLLDILTKLKKYFDFQVKGTSKILPFFLRAVYVHHGLNNKADYWADHCLQQCKMRNVPFHIIYINHSDLSKIKCNIEAMARDFRYKALFNALKPEEVLLTAHHMNDQVETVLLALKRGSGPAGLSGMTQDILYQHNEYQHRLLRPLLKCSHIQLQEYAYRKKLTWVEDDTNTDVRFDRNFLRVQVIPLFQKRWPAFNKVVSRTAQLCREQENLLHELLSESLDQLIDIDNALFFYPLIKYSDVRRRVVLRYWLSRFFINMPSYKLLDCIWKEVALSKVDSQSILHVGKKYICRRFRKKLYILPDNMKSSLDIFLLPWKNFNNTILLPNELGLLTSQSLTVNLFLFYKNLIPYTHLNMLSDIFLPRYHNNVGDEKILSVCFIRPPMNNEKVSIQFGYIQGLLHLANRDRGRKLKKIWQEYNVPPWLRNHIPLLFYNDTLISAIGIFITRNGSCIVNMNNLICNNKKSIILQKITWVQSDFYYRIFKNFVYNTLR